MCCGTWRTASLAHLGSTGTMSAAQSMLRCRGPAPPAPLSAACRALGTALSAGTCTGRALAAPSAALSSHRSVPSATPCCAALPLAGAQPQWCPRRPRAASATHRPLTLHKHVTPWHTTSPSTRTLEAHGRKVVGLEVGGILDREPGHLHASKVQRQACVDRRLDVRLRVCKERGNKAGHLKRGMAHPGSRPAPRAAAP